MVPKSYCWFETSFIYFKLQKRFSWPKKKSLLLTSFGSSFSMHLVSCKQMISGFSSFKYLWPLFFTHALNPATFHEQILIFGALRKKNLAIKYHTFLLTCSNKKEHIPLYIVKTFSCVFMHLVVVWVAWYGPHPFKPVLVYCLWNKCCKVLRFASK